MARRSRQELVDDNDDVGVAGAFELLDDGSVIGILASMPLHILRQKVRTRSSSASSTSSSLSRISGAEITTSVVTTPKSSRSFLSWMAARFEGAASCPSALSP